MTQGLLDDALESFRRGLAITEQLTKSNPSNTLWQHGHSLSHSQLGRVLRTQGKLDEALTYFRDSLAIIERLATAEPSNTQWQRDLTASYTKVGDVLALKDDVAEATKLYRKGLTIIERLAKSDPSNAGWRWDLIISQFKLAALGDEAARRWAFVVTEMRNLENENKLRPEWARFLPAAEAELAKASDTPVPQR